MNGITVTKQDNSWGSHVTIYVDYVLVAALDVYNSGHVSRLSADAFPGIKEVTEP